MTAQSKAMLACATAAAAIAFSAWAAFVRGSEGTGRPGTIQVASGPLAGSRIVSAPTAGDATTQVPSGTAAPSLVAAAPSGYSLAYADEFDGTALNTGDWYYRITSGKYAQGYMRSENVSVANGALRLRYGYEAIPGVTGNQYTGGGVISRNRFGYGYYEVRARLYNASTGAHTSFWSMGLRKGDVGAAFDPQINTDIAAGTLPEHNQIHEIDGFEHDSAQWIDMGTQTQASGTVIHRLGGRTAAQLGINFADWNVYAWELTPTTTRFYLNGVLQLDVPRSSYPSPFDPANFWLTLLPYSTNSNPGALPGYSEFDYFRFYKPSTVSDNLLGNPSFDVLPSTNPPLSLVSGWQEWGTASASNIITTNPRSGTRALRQGQATSYTVSTKQDLKYIPNGTYRLTAYVKSSGGQSQAVLRVLNYGGTERVQDIGAQANWTQVTIDNVAVTAGQATIAITSIGSGGQWLDVDDVVFQRI